MLLGSTPTKHGFWWDVAVACGFAALAMTAIQFVLTARFRIATAPFGIDAVYYFHHYVTYVVLAVVLAHPVLFVAVLVGFGHMRAVDYYSAAPAVGVLWMLVALSVAGVVAWVRIARPLMLLRSPYLVADVKPEHGETWTLSLVPDGHARFSFQPGQFAWASLGQSPFAMRERPFSLAGAPQPGGELKLTIKAAGDFTRRAGQIAPGTRAYVDGPYGAFSIDRHPAAFGYAFIAGGIGVTPALSMLGALADRGDTRRHLLFTAHGRWDRIPRREEIALLERRLDLRVVYTLEEPPAEWSEERGRITIATLDRYLPPERRQYEYFVCGPRAMSRAVERLLHELGIPGSRAHTEIFDMG